MILQSFLQQLSQFPARTEVVGLAGSASAYLLAQLWQRHPRRPFCVLTPTPTDAARVAADLAFFTPSAWRSRIYPFPAPEITLYHPVPRGPDVVAGRLRALTALHNRDPEEPLICVAPIAALSHPTLPPACHRQADRVLRLRETIALHELREWLIGVGYIDMPLVEEIGTIAVRGGLIDCWPPTESFPVRIELDGEVIASLRAFDPATQRSLGTLDRVNMGPAAELRLTPAMRTRALAQLRARADTAGLPASARRPLLDAIQQGRRVPLCDTLLPIFYDTPGYLTDYLPGETVVVICDPLAVAATADALATRTMSAWEEAEPIAKLLSPEEALRPGRECLAACAAHPCIYFGLESIETQVSLNVGIESTARLRGSLPPAGPDQDPLTPLAETLRQAQSDGYRLHIICHTEIAAARTVDLFRWHGLALQTEVGALSAGFRWPDERLCYLTEAELFGTKIARRPTKRPPVETFLNFHELAVGDHVVHEEHGIGRFLGLVTMPIGEIPNDYVTLEYLGGDKLYLPVYRLHLLQRYIGTGDGAPLVDRLGGTRFLKATQKALRSIRLMANDLLKIYAERRLHPGTAFSGRDQTMEEFESAFPYDETPDQWEAIEETLRDMQRDRPMDRLICGDVGYGKTEVAMRAAFRAAMDGKQVAVLTPTTLLAFQHYQTFSGRFAATPIRVAMVSRFLPHKEIGQVLADAAHGTVDILIGTHRLLQRDVTLPRLGLPCLAVDDVSMLHRYLLLLYARPSAGTRMRDAL
ncbi:MAG: DEAD/DEAH box helicase, partial [Deltaproteobacteria bacterium]|nr:DEAD/DEAH box helicase [Deltaproteobacteria bacterium]